MTIKVVSFNANGIRARAHQLEAICKILRPDILAIQETKVQDADFPKNILESFGYTAYFYGQKSYNGVALFSKSQPVHVQYGLPKDAQESQKRLIIGEFKSETGEKLIIINGYFPQGDNRDHPIKFPHKKRFFADLTAHLQDTYKPSQPILIVGDINVAPLDLDIGIGPNNAKRWLKTGKCCFLPEERAWLKTLMDWGLEDLFRQHYPKVDDKYSWFDYRSRGFEATPPRGLRIDLTLGTNYLANNCVDAGIEHNIRGMERPSDHCPIWASFNL